MGGIVRFPLVPVFLAYGLGICAGDFSPPLPLASLITASLTLISLWALFLYTKREPAATASALVVFFLLGLFSISPYLRQSSSPYSISRFAGRDEVIVDATLDRPPLRARERTEIYLRVHGVTVNDRRLPAQGRLLIFSKEVDRSLKRGDRLRLRAKIHRPDTFHNPGGFSYERYLSFQGIDAVGFLTPEGGYVKTGEGPSYSPLRTMDGIRDHIRRFIEEGASPPRSGVIKALVLGERDDIPEEITEQFIVAGIAHLLAISGDHLGIVGLLSFSLFFWFLKRSEFLLLSISVKKCAAALTLPVILLYMFIAGAGISVVRATIMVITFLFSILLGRERYLLHTLLLAAFLILLFSPPSLFDISFQLSFLAVFSILYLVPLLVRRRAEEPFFPPETSPWGVRLWSYLKISLIVTTVAIVGTAPFVALHFNRISVVGLLANLFFVPWVGFIIVPLSLTASLLSFFFYPLATLLLQLDDLLTLVLLRAVSLSASPRWASFFLSTPTALEIALFYLLLYSAAHLRRKRAATYLFFGCAIALVVDVAFWTVHARLQRKLVLTFIDVGHGDSIFIQFPRGKRMLIDGGGLHDDRFDIGRRVVAPFLWKKKIRRIDYVVLSHPDPDHFKGLEFIASSFSIGEFWDNGCRIDAASYVRLRNLLLERGIPQRSVNDQTPPLTIGGVRLQILNPPPLPRSQPRGGDPSELNDLSLVLKIEFGRLRILLTGDIERRAEYRMVRESLPIQADLIKVPHHGSASSSTQAFLDQVKPSYAIFTVSRRDPQRLPHPEVVRRYKRIGTNIFRTDYHGAITVVTDGETVTIQPFLRPRR